MSEQSEPEMRALPASDLVARLCFLRYQSGLADGQGVKDTTWERGSAVRDELLRRLRKIAGGAG